MGLKFERAGGIEYSVSVLCERERGVFDHAVALAAVTGLRFVGREFGWPS